MKKWVIVLGALTLSFGTVGSSHAVEREYGTGGCGLGSLLLGNEPGLVQILAATLNGIAGNQTFGITSGTLNCEKQANFASNQNLNQFVAANMDRLAQDIARGEGESLSTLVELMGITQADRPAAYAKLQSNFSNIFASEQVEAADVIDQVAITVAR